MDTDLADTVKRAMHLETISGRMHALSYDILLGAIRRFWKHQGQDNEEGTYGERRELIWRGLRLNPQLPRPIYIVFGENTRENNASPLRIFGLTCFRCAKSVDIFDIFNNVATSDAKRMPKRYTMSLYKQWRS